jgi:hypothetical protein
VSDARSHEEIAERPTLRVETVFHLADERKAQALAAQMVDRAHEIANMPDCECDVDVSVEWASPDDQNGSFESAVKPVRAQPAKR